MTFEEAFIDELEKIAFDYNDGYNDDPEERAKAEAQKNLRILGKKVRRVGTGAGIGAAVGGLGAGLLNKMRRRKLMSRMSSAKNEDEKHMLKKELEANIADKKDDIKAGLNAGSVLGGLAGYGYHKNRKKIRKLLGLTKKRKFEQSDRFKGIPGMG